MLGAIAVAWAQSTLSEQFPSGWTYVQGVLFMLVIAFLPGGLASLGGAVARGSRAGRAPARTEPPPPATGDAAGRGRRRRGEPDATPTTWRSRGLTVSFDGFVAVDGVDLTVLPGDLRFLIGPNGAGKTTLIDAVSGLVPATGSVRVRRAAS